MAENSTWFTGTCKQCGYNVVVTQPDNEQYRFADYWWYCSNKKCEHHQTGEHTGDMEHPDWVQLWCSEEYQLRAMVDEFTRGMKEELLAKMGHYHGWDDDDSSNPEEKHNYNFLMGEIENDFERFKAGDIKQAIHIANRLAMLWKMNK